MNRIPKADRRHQRDLLIEQLVGRSCEPGKRHYRRRRAARTAAKDMARTQGGGERLVYPCPCGNGYCISTHGAMTTVVKTRRKKRKQARAR